MFNKDHEYDNKTTNIDNRNIINSWEELKIGKDLLRGIYANGFEKPSPIQSKAIIPILEKTGYYCAGSIRNR